MADQLGDFEKRTSTGGHFVIRFFDDGTLLEWDAKESPDHSWPGTWSSGAVKKDFIQTTIGTSAVRLEPDGYGQLVGVENDQWDVSVTMSTADIHRLQGYAMHD